MRRKLADAIVRCETLHDILIATCIVPENREMGLVGSMAAREEWARGWPLVLASVFGILLSAVFAGGLSTALTAIQQQTGWSRATITAGPMVAAAIPLFMGPLPGIVIDRVGPRAILRIAIPAYAAAVASLGLGGSSLVLWFSSWAVIGILSPFANPVIWTVVLSRVFDASRGSAFAVGMCGVGLAHFITPLISISMLERFGWQAVFPAIGLAGLVMAYPLALVVLGRHASAGKVEASDADLPGMEVREIFASFRFWAIAVMVVLQYGALGTLFVHLQPLYLKAGIDAVAAAKYASTMGLSLIAGRLFGGYLVDRLPARRVAAAICILPVIACILLLGVAGSPTIALVSPLLIGFAMGSEGDIIAYMAAKYFGPRHFGSAISVYMAIYTVGFAFAPVVGSIVYDALGSYDRVLIWIAISLVAAALLALSIGRPPAFRLQQA